MKARIMYSPMMGIGASLSLFTETPAVTIEDYLFDNTTTGEVTPLATGTGIDYHDTWDLDGTDFTPEASPDDEGYWDDNDTELVTNGGFDADSDWSLDTGWSISSGKLRATSTALEATQTSVFTAGSTYEVTFTVDSIASGSIKVKAGASTGTIRTTAGTYTEILDVASGTSLVFDMHASGSCVIDSVSVTEYSISPLDV
tara:strand:- start:13 stop:612 length:600 start_codon:yes stop_codon:yes gene_type:complete